MLSSLSPTEFPSRLELIRERERNWRSPERWGAVQKLTLPPMGTVYDFCGGYYANGLEDENKITSGISFFELPSTERGTNSDAPLKTWTHAMGDVKIVDFTMDPAQDLLVLVVLAPPQCEFVYQVHLRSFTTNEPHTESSLPMGVLTCLPEVDGLIPLKKTGAVRVQVAGDLVALLVKGVPDSVSAHLQIWNWRHGSHYSCAMAQMAGIEDFAFLSDNTFLIIRPSGRFECYTFENPISCSTTPELESSYSLPPLQDGFMYWYICMSSNPTLGNVSGGDDTDERILACGSYIFSPAGAHQVHSFVFFLNVKMFLDESTHSRQMQQPRSLLGANTTTPWEEWGPQNTRWFDEALSTDWQHASYGLKTVECIDTFELPPMPANTGEASGARFDAAGHDDDTSVAPPPVNPQTLDPLDGIGSDVVDDDGRAAGDTTREQLDSTRRHLRIRDFNPHSLLIDGDQAEDGNGNGKTPAREPASRWARRIVTTPSTTLSRGVFVEDIVSSLPYSEVISEEKYNVTDVMVDDCRVLLMQRGFGGKLEGIDILTM